MQRPLDPKSYNEAFWHDIKKRWPGKFRDLERFIFREIRPGNRIFIGTGCGSLSTWSGRSLISSKSSPNPFLMLS